MSEQHTALPIDQSVVNVTATWLAPAGSPDVCSVAVPPAGGAPGAPKIGPFANYPGCTVSVQVSYPYSFYFPLLPATTTTTAPCTSAGFCLSSTSQMVISH